LISSYAAVTLGARKKLVKATLSHLPDGDGGC